MTMFPMQSTPQYNFYPKKENMCMIFFNSHFQNYVLVIIF